MRWEDERWVKVYTRDTGEWLALGWEAQALFLFALRKADRAGILKTGKMRSRGLAGMTGMPLDVVERSIPLLLEDGCMRETDGGYVIPNFLAAQEAQTSASQRKRDQRERDRARALVDGMPAETSGMITDSMGARSRQEVTPGCRAMSSRQDVTPGCHAGTVTPRVDESRVEETRENTLSEEAAVGEKPADLRALWNAEADPRLPRWRDLTDKRATQAAARLAERPLAEWRIILGRINGSPFCLGQNDRGWKADVEFFLRPDTATKVLEGKYDPKGRLVTQSSLLPKADDPNWVTV